jgi:hypothetical protein
MGGSAQPARRQSRNPGLLGAMFGRLPRAASAVALGLALTLSAAGAHAQQTNAPATETRPPETSATAPNNTPILLARPGVLQPTPINRLPIGSWSDPLIIPPIHGPTPPMFPHFATLTWNAPTSHDDATHTPLLPTERLGYEICHSTSPINLNTPTCDGVMGQPLDVGVLPTIDLGQGPQCTFTWMPIATGETHYFRVRAYLIDAQGHRLGPSSRFSNEASKTLP